MKNIKKILCAVLALTMMLCMLTGCGGKNVEVDDTGAAKISFANSSLNEVTSLKDQKVTITGYMSMLSPIDGTLIYLVNLPMQACPFCEQNSKQLTTSMAVVLDKPVEDITLDPIKVVGTLKIGNFVDDYGYEYMYRIEDATYEVLDETSLPDGYDVYYNLSSTDDIYKLYYMMTCVDFYAYYDYYELTTAQILAEPKVNLEECGYKEALERAKSFNDERYNPYIEMVEKCVELETKINQYLDAKDANGLKSLQPDVDKLFDNFNKFIKKYST